MPKLIMGIVLHNDSSGTPFVREVTWPYDALPQYNSEFLLQPGSHPSGLHAVRVVGLSYDLCSSELRFIEVCFDPDRYRSEYYTEARQILEKELFKEIDWENWFARTYPWVGGVDAVPPSAQAAMQ